jgi:hypothetical protein
VAFEAKGNGDDLQRRMGGETRYPGGDDIKLQEIAPGVDQPQGDPEEFLCRHKGDAITATE